MDGAAKEAAGLQRAAQCRAYWLRVRIEAVIERAAQDGPPRGEDFDAALELGTDCLQRVRARVQRSDPLGGDHVRQHLIDQGIAEFRLAGEVMEEGALGDRRPLEDRARGGTMEPMQVDR